MTQVSANTLTYDQVFFKIRSFLQKDIQNKFISKDQRLEEYNNLLMEIYNSISGPSIKYEPYIKGEPPSSYKFNKFSSSLAESLNSLAKQLDYLNAKTVNTFNLFYKEIENEKKYSERIASKVKILQMYSRSPSNDMVYIGDSFDNLDQIDIESIAKNLNPSIVDGAFTLPIKNNRIWPVKSMSITASNGYMGNNHEVIRSTNPEGDTYAYVFDSNPGISSIAAITDSNPLTYFEYEAISVDKTSNQASVVLRSENEFCYVVDSKVESTVPVGQLVNWSNYDVNSPLKLTTVLEGASTTSTTNSISITPYFGSTNLIKVTQILVTDSSGSSENILNEPIYIGSSMVPLNIESSKNYYYNKAVIRYPERKTSKVAISFEQDSHYQTQIQHIYWKPDYKAGEITNSPFVGLSRFNPDAFNRDIYEEVQYDKNALIPSTANPNQFKKTGLVSIPKFKVSLKKKPVTYNKWIVTFNANGKKSYFYDWYESNSEAGADFVVSTALPNNPVYDAGNLKVGSSLTSDTNTALVIASLTVDVDDKIVLKNQLNPQLNGTYIVKQKGSVTEKWKIVREVQIQWTDVAVFENPNLTPKYFETQTAGQSYLDSVKKFIQLLNGQQIVANGTQYTISDAAIEYISYTAAVRTEVYDVPLIAQKEIYSAKRMAIGIRDISVGYETYANEAEIISTPYNFDLPIEALMVSVENSIPDEYRDKINVFYNISIDGSPFADMPISPIQLDTNGTAEVLVFNQNISDSEKLPGVAYINYPKVPIKPKTVKFRIRVVKDRNVNITPIFYSYELIAKVKR